MGVRVTSLIERLRGSLFVVPMGYVIASLALAVVTIETDREVLDAGTDLPFALTSTVDSARSVLETIGSATITFAGIAFSISLLVIQLASSQHSPRVVRGLLRDPFTTRVMGVVIGTFTYCLVVLRAVRGPLEEGGAPVIPNISVAVAVVLGVVSILAIIAFISHSAHVMDVSTILARAAEEGVSAVDRLWHEDPPQGEDPDPVPEAPDDHLLVTHAASGWVRDVDFDQLARAADPGGTVRLETEVGSYAVAGTPLCAIWPAPADPDGAREGARRAVIAGESRTVEQDVAYAVRQLADVALRALSPGINDPTTAQDALFHLARVLQEVLSRHPPRLSTPMPDGRALLRPERRGHEELVDLAFDEIRLSAAGMPTVCAYLLEVLHLLHTAVALQPDRTEEVVAAIRRQAALVRASADRADLGASDADRIRDAHDRRFGPPTAPVT